MEHGQGDLPYFLTEDHLLVKWRQNLKVSLLGKDMVSVLQST